MTPRLSLNLGKLELANPVMVASGTFGYAEEFSDFFSPRILGAIVTKTITLQPRQGNDPPRTCETPAGMLNSIGLENPGVEAFLGTKLPVLRRFGPPVIVSIASEGRPLEFVELARRLSGAPGIAALELNISCPNIKSAHPSRIAAESAALISQDAKATFALVKAVRKAWRKTLITKLSPNVTRIADIAQAAERAGSDALSLVNTLSGMCIDIRTGRPKLAALTGGLSGPAIRPVAVRMVWEVSRRVKLPLIGMGGITDTASALEFFIAGASAVSIGTANFIEPRAPAQIIEGIRRHLREHNIRDIRDFIGSLKTI